MTMQKKSTDEDELINRLGAILLLPTKAESRRIFSKDHLRSNTFFSNQTKDSISSSSKLHSSPLRSSNHSGSISPSPFSSNNKNRDSINTTTFGRSFKVSPLTPEGHSGYRSILPQNEIASTFDERKTPADIISNKNLAPQIYPGDAFVKDEITGVHLQEKNTELVDEWLKDISRSNSSVSSIVKPKPKVRQGLHRRPTLFGKGNREVSTSKTPLEHNNNLNSDNIVNVSRKNSIKHRSKSWKANYLAKRHLISKLYIPPRKSSLPNSDKNHPITPPSVSFKFSELPRRQPIGIQVGNPKFQGNTGSSYGALYETLFQKTLLPDGLFTIQTTNTNNFEKSIILKTSEGLQQEVAPTNHVRLPHFRSLLRKRRPLRVRRLSNRKVSVRCL